MVAGVDAKAWDLRQGGEEEESAAELLWEQATSTPPQLLQISDLVLTRIEGGTASWEVCTLALLSFCFVCPNESFVFLLRVMEMVSCCSGSEAARIAADWSGCEGHRALG